MNVSQVMKGDPYWLKGLLETLAITNTITIVEKTNFAGSFMVVSDDTGSAGQTVEVVRGTPEDLVAALNVISGGGGVINVLEKTFAAGFYVVVYT